MFVWWPPPYGLIHFQFNYKTRIVKIDTLLLIGSQNTYHYGQYTFYVFVMYLFCCTCTLWCMYMRMPKACCCIRYACINPIFNRMSKRIVFMFQIFVAIRVPNWNDCVLWTNAMYNYDQYACMLHCCVLIVFYWWNLCIVSIFMVIHHGSCIQCESQATAAERKVIHGYIVSCR